MIYASLYVLFVGSIDYIYTKNSYTNYYNSPYYVGLVNFYWKMDCISKYTTTITYTIDSILTDVSGFLTIDSDANTPIVAYDITTSISILSSQITASAV